MGNPKAVRAVGSALRKNPFAPEVPCHRVIASNLTIGGFHRSKDLEGELIQKKIRMLKEEGVEFDKCDSTNIRISPSSVISDLPM